MARPITPDEEHSWPWDIREKPEMQDVVDEYYHETDKLAAIWKTRYDENRTDVSHEQFVKQIEVDSFGDNLSESVLSERLRSYIENNLKTGIYRYIKDDPYIRKYQGSGFSGPIEVDVDAGPRLIITVHGPDWLRFYFTGWRTYTVHAKPHVQGAHGSRGMLVFYDSEGRKIVTKSVTIPGHPPGLYIERAVQDLMVSIQPIIDQENERDEEVDDDTYFADLDYAQERAYREVQELQEEKAELVRLKHQVSQLMSIEEFQQMAEEDERELDYEITKRKHLMDEARIARSRASQKNKSFAGLIQNDAVQAYLSAYAVGVQTFNSNTQDEKIDQAASKITSRIQSKSTKMRVKKVKEHFRKK